ncbi:MAG: histidine kinase [Ectothiorhodospiraceae bacterium]|nr:histidine kinase [Ectothiorhodospiraceae bacterium]
MGRAPMVPRGLLGLILLGLLVVAIPLVLALATSVITIDRLIVQGEDAVYRSVQATQQGRALLEKVRSMERAARQYLLLNDPRRLTTYEELRVELRDLLRTDRAEPAGSGSLASTLALREQELWHLLRGTRPGSAESLRVVDRAATLGRDVRELLAARNAAVDAEVEVLRQMAVTARRLLLWQGIAAVPVLAALSLLFSRLVARPVRQLEAAVHRLGQGDLEPAVRIDGPEDFQAFGARLDWLRLRLREAQQHKQRFLRHISHELKTPLTAIREGTELLADGHAGPLADEQRAILDIVRRGTRELARLIEDLLAFSRLPAARGNAPGRERVRLDEAVRQAAQAHALTLRARGLTLALDTSALVVDGDPSMLRTLVDNLLSNAIKYSPPGGRIDVTLHRRGGDAVLEVRDAGPGVPEPERALVFEAFYQGAVQPAGTLRGTGLGLSIARECARLHGGDIGLVDTDAEGACFRAHIPLAAGDRPSVIAAIRPASGPPAATSA